MKCQCEHEDHEYPCPNEAVQWVKTIYGRYKVCATCYTLEHMRLKQFAVQPLVTCERCGLSTHVNDMAEDNDTVCVWCNEGLERED
jgi:translation initiation factor 2 beta subunit (eIF-2beta)/eIF-5